LAARAAEGQGGYPGRAAAITGRAGKTAAESRRAGLSAQFFPAMSKVGTVDARY